MHHSRSVKSTCLTCSRHHFLPVPKARDKSLWWATLPTKAHARETGGAQRGSHQHNILWRSPLHLVLQYLVSLSRSGPYKAFRKKVCRLHLHVKPRIKLQLVPYPILWHNEDGKRRTDGLFTNPRSPCQRPVPEVIKKAAKWKHDMLW